MKTNFYRDTFELQPTDGRKSFYGKAFVEKLPNGDLVLYSYRTPVCMMTKVGEFIRLCDAYSATTMRHVNAFLAAVGIDGGGKAWWNAQPVAC